MGTVGEQLCAESVHALYIKHSIITKTRSILCIVLSSEKEQATTTANWFIKLREVWTYIFRYANEQRDLHRNTLQRKGRSNNLRPSKPCMSAACL